MKFAVGAASPFHTKANAFVTGRRELWNRMSAGIKANDKPVVWIHCASLGEFEQGRPVIEKLKKEYSTVKILLTFFSPSGYEVRKNYALADYVYYLPWDTRRNAQRFIQLARPALAIFVKYEFWHHFTSELARRNVPLISISSIFRSNQIFFKPYGGFFQKTLHRFNHFFVQNQASVQLLNSIGLKQVTHAGDTRFDRVMEIAGNHEAVPVAATFKSESQVMVAGSCWPEDMEVLAPLINEGKMKFIIAPHEISESFLTAIEKSLQVQHIRYSLAMGTAQPLDSYQVLIIDNVGLLSRLYYYGELAFVGGAFGKGLHNILEAACFGVPIFFGNRNYQKFKEAVDLINRGGAFDVRDYTELKAKLEMLLLPENFQLACEVTKQYVQTNTGATTKIMKYCRTLLVNSAP